MPTPSAPPERAVARFRDDVAQLIGEPGNSRFGLAVSGGPDSLALLLLASAAFPGQVLAATVDHGLRPDSRVEAEYVRDIGKALGVEHYVATVSVPAGGNLQARARQARYHALLGWVEAASVDWLITGHHADDQLETMIMRLNRSSGVGGLAGIRRRDDVLLRPLLGWRRAELGEIVAQCGLDAVQDPSNDDVRFDRARLRRDLATADWLDAMSASRSAAALADADDALDHHARLAYGDCVSEGDAKCVIIRAALLEQPFETRRRVLLRALQHAAPAIEVREATLATVIEAIATRRKVSVGPLTVAVNGEYILVQGAPPRRAAPPRGTA